MCGWCDYFHFEHAVFLLFKKFSKRYLIISFIFMKMSVCFKVKAHKILVGFALTLLWSKHRIYLKMENYNFHTDSLSVRGRVCVFSLKECNIEMESYEKMLKLNTRPS